MLWLEARGERVELEKERSFGGLLSPIGGGAESRPLLAGAVARTVCRILTIGCTQSTSSPPPVFASASHTGVVSPYVTRPEIIWSGGIKTEARRSPTAVSRPMFTSLGRADRRERPSLVPVPLSPTARLTVKFTAAQPIPGRYAARAKLYLAFQNEGPACMDTRRAICARNLIGRAVAPRLSAW